MSENSELTSTELVTFLRKRDYQFVGELGSGACGKTVLLNDDVIDQRFVCKKYCPYSESMRGELFANFVREIKLLHRVHHPNLVRVYNYYLYPDQFTGYILMEHVDGMHVTDFLASHPEKASDIFLQAVDGFGHLESAGILHRDIRPGNVMVSADGELKIIDLGFGKQIVRSADFDKSISLNWWCDPPLEFREARYDFSTEVYFVGKLFEQIVRDNSIAHFHYTDALRAMCSHDPRSRISSFIAVLQVVRNNQFSELSFSAIDMDAYRRFAEELCDHITKIDRSTRYIDDIARIERSLSDAYQKVMLEVTVPDCSIITQCFLEGTYYFKAKGFQVDAVRDFLALIRACTAERASILLANLHTRMNTITRYSPPVAGQDDIPF